MINERSDTIAAISTALGKSGIGIVRISGPDALRTISPIVKSPIDNRVLSNLKSRKLIHSFLIDSQGEIIDEVLIAFMPPEKSFTGEYTVEINCHGGLTAVTMALEMVLKNGARLAEPGEFTRRACLNGRITLIQAEAINQVIESTSIDALKLAWRQFEGGLTERCQKLRLEIVDMLSQIQYHIDFDDYQDSNVKEEIQHKINLISQTIENMIACSERTQAMNRAIWVSLYGPPNVGKSSLFNALLRMPRAIVCDAPGTTRDHISEIMVIKGHEIRLTDTAGIRISGDEVESESIRRSLEQVKSADIKIFVLDISQKIDQEQEDEIFKVLSGPGIVIFNKLDIKKPELEPLEIKSENAIEVSTKTGENLDKLEKCIEDIIVREFSNSNELLMLTLRQKSLLEKCLENMRNISSVPHIALDIISFELRSFVDNIDKITGAITNDEILDNVFTNFCIGK